jgi:hypothetical protein
VPRRVFELHLEIGEGLAREQGAAERAAAASAAAANGRSAGSVERPSSAVIRDEM